MKQDDAVFMKKALAEAVRAGKKQEVPVGAVLVHKGKVLARGHNVTRTQKDPTGHAEMVALRRGAKKQKNERLVDCDLYVTLEPCAMCAGAIVQARVARVIYGARDPKAGACGSTLRVLPNKKLNHRPKIVRGVLAEASAHLLTSFFRRRRG